MSLKFSGNVFYIYNRFWKSEKNVPRIYAALKNFGQSFQELKNRRYVVPPWLNIATK